MDFLFSQDAADPKAKKGQNASIAAQWSTLVEKEKLIKIYENEMNNL